MIVRNVLAISEGEFLERGICAMRGAIEKLSEHSAHYWAGWCASLLTTKARDGRTQKRLERSRRRRGAGEADSTEVGN